jgi:Anti-sigma-K factor rskA
VTRPPVDPPVDPPTGPRLVRAPSAGPRARSDSSSGLTLVDLAEVTAETAREGTPTSISPAAPGEHDEPTDPANEIEAFRIQELLLLRATEGLPPIQTAELAALGGAADDTFDLAAAAVDLATLPREELPYDVAQRILAAAGARPPRAAAEAGAPRRSTRAGTSADDPTSFSRAASRPGTSGFARVARPGLPTHLTPYPGGGLAGPPTPTPVPRLRIASSGEPYPPLPTPPAGPAIRIPRPPRASPVAARAPFAARRTLLISLGAAVAGAAIAAAVVFWAVHREPEVLVQKVEVPGPPAPPAPPPSPAIARAHLLASAVDVQTLPWNVTSDPTGRGVTGDVVWSPSLQEGYLRFAGLPANDPSTHQYQLWIFDKRRDDRFPVDGGVFDIAPTGEIIVKISPKLFIAEPVLFAITLERPGGVVVSKRERIVVTAAPAKG